MIKVQIVNSDLRQFPIDTKGKGNYEDIYLIGINEVIVLDVEESQLKKIINELPQGAQLNILKKG